MRCLIYMNPFWYLLTISFLYIFLFKRLEMYNPMCLHFQHRNGAGRLKPNPMHDPTMTGPDNKDHRANMGPTWVLSAPDGSHVGPMNLANRASIQTHLCPPVLNRQGVVEISRVYNIFHQWQNGIWDNLGIHVVLQNRGFLSLVSELFWHGLVPN